MSLSLDRGTKPVGLRIKTYGLGPLEKLGQKVDVVYLGDYEISLKDFLFAADYVLTNTDLRPNDPRLTFVEHVQSMKVVETFNPNGSHLEPEDNLMLPL
jgi:hypothetical protein